jgi:hypothetical protein
MMVTLQNARASNCKHGEYSTVKYSRVQYSIVHERMQGKSSLVSTVRSAIDTLSFPTDEKAEGGLKGVD